ncbi:peptide-methionine (S)-S-oxide reductase MsrA [Aliikangiella sp. G2MR2-5]|uniref:peptide-methionine (S)-S-oxide reductase MsrA n=1 Tax=Aliikangiella sp. G2MR2-5 TaxID=2788943 RepID=UPI0018AB8BBF|nr:peptide-methionine (S)-S-oxide reductase MsrA [Aliikangiella sp. G2MR2-5]
MNTESHNIILGGGCFWCIEAGFQRLFGIEKVVSGYAGGEASTANYKDVCSGVTGHAEVVQIFWDPAKIELDSILEHFFKLHDPTTKDRQGNDVGPQYRSYIGYQDDRQLEISKEVIARTQSKFNQPITTELAQSPSFYPAEIEHQDYYNRNSNQPYCQLVIRPKLDKLNSSS